MSAGIFIGRFPVVALGLDFRSPRRLLPGIQDNFNRKGLVSDAGEKKKAFFLLQKAYRENSVGKAQ